MPNKGVATTATQVAVVWSALLGLMIGVGLLITEPLKAWLSPDEANFSEYLEEHRTAALTDVAEVAGTGGDTVAVIVVAVCVSVAAWFWTRSARPAVFLLVGLAGQAVLYEVAGTVVERQRPQVNLLDHGLDPAHSFPSGHVSSAVTLWGGCAILLWVYARPRWRLLAGVLVLVPLAVGFARLYQGAHYVTDVAASLLVAPLWIGALAFIVLESGRAATRAEGEAEPAPHPPARAAAPR